MVYGYIRVSTDMQDSEAQKIGITEAAAKRGLTIDAWIADDGVSGTVDPTKRRLGKLLKKLKEDDTIIASEISRFGRSLFMIFDLLKFFTEHKIKVFTVKDGYELKNDISSTVLAFAFGMAAQIERDMISKRTIEGLERRRREGVVLGRPLGSHNVSNPKLSANEAKVKSLLQKGISMSGIARIIGVHRQTVANWVERNGWEPEELKNTRVRRREEVKRRRKGGPNSLYVCPLTEEELIARYKECRSITRMCQELNVSTTTLRAHMVRNGIWEKIKAIQDAQKLKCPSLSQQERDRNS